VDRRLPFYEHLLFIGACLPSVLAFQGVRGPVVFARFRPFSGAKPILEQPLLQ
jgi:hypothetical protein